MEGADLHHLIDLAPDLQDASRLMGCDRGKFIQLAARRLVD